MIIEHNATSVYCLSSKSDDRIFQLHQPVDQRISGIHRGEVIGRIGILSIKHCLSTTFNDVIEECMALIPVKKRQTKTTKG